MVGDRDQLHRQLLEAKVDIAMGSVPLALAPGAEQLRYYVLCEDDLYVVAGQHHPLAKRDELHLSEPLSYPWIIPPLDPQGVCRSERAGVAQWRHRVGRETLLFPPRYPHDRYAIYQHERDRCRAGQDTGGARQIFLRFLQG